jgi:RecJ-like exonuclease
MSWDWQKLLDKGVTGQSLTKRGTALEQCHTELLYGQEHPCAFCRGTGQVRGAYQCPVCGGAAKVGFAPPAVQCAFCHGGGHWPLRSDATCPACRGSGAIGVSPPIQVCTKCRGRGRQTGQPLYCGRCRGAGVVTVSESNDRRA